MNRFESNAPWESAMGSFRFSSNMRPQRSTFGIWTSGKDDLVGMLDCDMGNIQSRMFQSRGVFHSSPTGQIVGFQRRRSKECICSPKEQYRYTTIQNPQCLEAVIGLQDIKAGGSTSCGCSAESSQSCVPLPHRFPAPVGSQSGPMKLISPLSTLGRPNKCQAL